MAESESIESMTDATIFAEAGIDSLDQVNLIIAIEEAYGIEIPEETSNQWETAGQIIDYLVQHVA